MRYVDITGPAKATCPGCKRSLLTQNLSTTTRGQGYKGQLALRVFSRGGKFVTGCKTTRFSWQAFQISKPFRLVQVLRKAQHIKVERGFCLCQALSMGISWPHPQLTCKIDTSHSEGESHLLWECWSIKDFWGFFL